LPRPAGYNVQALDGTKVRKRSNFLVPFLGLVAIVAMIGIYVAGPVPNKQNEAGATPQKPNDDPEKAELVKRMRDAAWLAIMALCRKRRRKQTRKLCST
jgi:hypothetical protein